MHKILRKGIYVVKKLGVYCGATLLDVTDLVETNSQNKIMLEYYRVKKYCIDKIKLKAFYGITVVKKEYGKDEIKCEKKSINKISTSERKMRNIIDLLRINKVTPIALNDVLADLLKQPQFQEE